MQSKDYSKLGGWLLVFFLCLCFRIAQAMLALARYIRDFQFLIIYYGYGFLLRLLIAVVLPAVLLFICGYKLQKKDPTFLLFFEINIVLSVLLLFTVPVRISLVTLIYMIVRIGWRIYLHRSVRVKMYMGGNAFLRRSLLSFLAPRIGYGVKSDGDAIPQQDGGGNAQMEASIASPYGDVEVAAAAHPGEACNSCGFALRRESVFCPKCGSKRQYS